jgi:hypothetical protein
MRTAVEQIIFHLDLLRLQNDNKDLQSVGEADCRSWVPAVMLPELRLPPGGPTHVTTCTAAQMQLPFQQH